jgi:monoterpene epsilon-lactone hydrolase
MFAIGELMISTQKRGGGKIQNHRPWSVIYPLNQEDSTAVAALRSVVGPMKGKFEGTTGRGPFNDIMERVVVPEGVTFEAAIVAGISGWWAKPARAQKGAAIIDVHGGWFNWGTA